MMEMTDVSEASAKEQQPREDEEAALENGNGVMNGGGAATIAPSLHDNVHSLPTVEEMTGKSVGGGANNRGAGGGGIGEEDDVDGLFYEPSRNDGYTMLVTFCCFFLMVVAASVGAGVGVHKRNQREIAAQEYRQNIRFREVVNYIGNHSISTWDDLLLDGSPQNIAANWIALEDEIHMKVPDVGPTHHPYANDFVTRYILVVIYHVMGGSAGTWTDDLNFLTPQHHCEWFQIIVEEYAMFPRGVACNATNRRHGVMDALFLDNNGLTGTIPNEMGMLTTMEVLNLDMNEIRGGIPRAFVHLQQLQHLSIAHNTLTGDIPQTMHFMLQLETIDLSYNFIAGTLPIHMSQMPRLTALAVDNNGMTGDINKVFGNYALTHNNLPTVHNVTGQRLGNVDMEALYLEDNLFDTTLDETFLHGMDNLKRLDISGNNINGSIPQHLFAMPSLEVLDLHHNKITGRLPVIPPPADRGYTLQYLALHQNQLSGPIEPTLNRLTNLKHLDLAENTLTSTIPDDLGELNQLTYLFLAQNNFAPGTIPISLASLAELQELSLKSTSRTGTIPSEVFQSNALRKLILLDLDDNAFTGTIPNSLGSLRDIQFLLLNNNQLTGTVPSPEFETNLLNLRLLFLDQNQLTGSLDATICNKPPNSFMPYIISDCGDHSTIPASDVEIECNCCFKCCSDNNPCNDNDFIPSNDPMWQFGYQRIFYIFGDRHAWFALP